MKAEPQKKTKVKIGKILTMVPKYLIFVILYLFRGMLGSVIVSVGKLYPSVLLLSPKIIAAFLKELLLANTWQISIILPHKCDNETMNLRLYKEL